MSSTNVTGLWLALVWFGNVAVADVSSRGPPAVRSVLADERRLGLRAPAERRVERLAHDLRDRNTALRGPLLHPADEIVVCLNDESPHGIMISDHAGRICASVARRVRLVPAGMYLGSGP